MKRIVVLLLLLVCCLSLCACGTADTVSYTTKGYIHIERHYQDSGDLFCIVETNTDSGVIVTTYFYWQYDDAGRRTLTGTECVIIDRDGKIISSEFSSGQS